MPKVGEIRIANTIGYKNNHTKMIWTPCIICGIEKWRQLKLETNKPRNERCRLHTHNKRPLTKKSSSPSIPSSSPKRMYRE